MDACGENHAKGQSVPYPRWWFKTFNEVNMSAECSASWMHVERIMQRIKVYHILDGDLRLSMKHIAEQIFTVCAYLTNFQNPIPK